MSVAADLQAVRSRLSAAIAGADTFGRVELGRLEKEIGLIQEDAAREERRAKVERIAFDALADGVDRQVLDLKGLAKRVRQSRDRGLQPEQVAA